MQFNIGVTDLAAFVHRRGDIDDRAEDLTTAREGLDTQRAYQQRLKHEVPTYRTEVQVACDFKLEAIEVRVTGRVDGVALVDELQGKQLIVEEIKTTRRDSSDVPLCDRSVHEAQLRLYAAMLARDGEATSLETRLTYVHPETRTPKTYTAEESFDDLECFLKDTVGTYCAWLNVVVKRLNRRNEQAAAQLFPHQTYNENQLPLARAGYISLRDKSNLLVEAPTGTGKTIATTFPAVKAIGESKLDRVVYATARTTGQQAAADAFSLLRESNDALVHTTVSAKERVCLTPGAACRPDECEYAKGHYDRVRDATQMLLRKGDVDRDAVDAVAKSKKVCPFELSLDVAEWSDAVICDYNYVFDPFVQLKRLRSRLFGRVGLLVDEAHRLTERVRDMLSCEFDLAKFDEAVTETQDTPIGPLLQTLQRILTGSFDDLLPIHGETTADEITSDLETAAERLLASDKLRLQAAAAEDVVNECLFSLLRFRTITALRDDNPGNFVWLLSRTESDRRMRLRCLLPDSWIRDTVREFHGSIRFSGTLAPGELFNEEHGLVGPIRQATIAPNKRRLSVFTVPDISTYWSDRTATAPAIADLLERIHEAASGNWLVAFPSFTYLELVLDLVKNPDLVLAQKRQMNLEEREEFLAQLERDERSLGFVVMGGVFTESIDIEQTSLEGVVVISPGLPPKSLELDQLKERSPYGYEIAYRRPAMTRVIQAAGRVVRSEADRGAVVLVDPRFTRSDFAQYFPAHWEPQVVKSDALIPALQAFQAGNRS